MKKDEPVLSKAERARHRKRVAARKKMGILASQLLSHCDRTGLPAVVFMPDPDKHPDSTEAIVSGCNINENFAYDSALTFIMNNKSVALRLMKQMLYSGMEKELEAAEDQLASEGNGLAVEKSIEQEVPDSGLFMPGDTVRVYPPPEGDEDNDFISKLVGKDGTVQHGTSRQVTVLFNTTFDDGEVFTGTAGLAPYRLVKLAGQEPMRVVRDETPGQDVRESVVIGQEPYQEPVQDA